MKDENVMDISHVKETGLIQVAMYGQSVELCMEDIDEINRLVKILGKSKIANKEDFI